MSHIICADEGKKCSKSVPMPYNTFQQYANTIPNTDTEKQNKLKKFVCGTNNGTLMQCCDSEDVSFRVNATGSNLINPIIDASGNITEYQICRCTTQKCEKQNCVSFRTPTKYEVCKISNVKKENVIQKDSYVNRILINNTLPDCYKKCS